MVMVISNHIPFDLKLEVMQEILKNMFEHF